MKSDYYVFKDLDKVKDKTKYFKNLVPESRKQIIEYEDLLRSVGLKNLQDETLEEIKRSKNASRKYIYDIASYRPLSSRTYCNMFEFHQDRLSKITFKTDKDNLKQMFNKDTDTLVLLILNLAYMNETVYKEFQKMIKSFDKN